MNEQSNWNNNQLLVGVDTLIKFVWGIFPLRLMTIDRRIILSGVIELYIRNVDPINEKL